MLLRLSKIDVLVVDDWAMTPLNEAEARDFWESRRPVPSAIAGADVADAGGEVAWSDRRFDGGGRHTGSHRSPRAPDRVEKRFDAEKSATATRAMKPLLGLCSAEGKGPQLPAPSPGPLPRLRRVSLRCAPDGPSVFAIPITLRNNQKASVASLIVGLSSVRHDGDIHSRRAGGLWKTACVLLESRGEPACTNFASLTRDVFRRASTGGMPGFPDEFSDVV